MNENTINSNIIAISVETSVQIGKSTSPNTESKTVLTHNVIDLEVDLTNKQKQILETKKDMNVIECFTGRNMKPHMMYVIYCT